LALQKLKAELMSRAVAGGAVMVKAAVDHTTVKHDSKVRGTLEPLQVTNTFNGARGRTMVTRGTSAPSNSILLGVCGAAQGSSFRCDDGSSVRTKLILDCSGFGSKLVELDGDAVPGVQVQIQAYQALADRERYQADAVVCARPSFSNFVALCALFVSSSFADRLWYRG
jgi:hypothetical protein